MNPPSWLPNSSPWAHFPSQTLLLTSRLQARTHPEQKHLPKDDPLQELQQLEQPKKRQELVQLHGLQPVDTRLLLLLLTTTAATQVVGGVPLAPGPEPLSSEVLPLQSAARPPAVRWQVYAAEQQPVHTASAPEAWVLLAANHGDCTAQPSLLT
mmetsp:Transcript_129040/g.234798  ORF Transcript_129040/g.234798 Transcript_129040/m.234798 type:complete len:154 (+) Transcript_129040:129-590(+)